MLSIKEQVNFLSGSTLAWCIRDLGCQNTTITYDMIDDFKNKLIDFIDANNWNYSRWQDAYIEYKESL